MPWHGVTALLVFKHFANESLAGNIWGALDKTSQVFVLGLSHFLEHQGSPSPEQTASCFLRQGNSHVGLK